MSSCNDKDEWKNLIDGDEMEEVKIETVQQWMEHPKRDLVINWKDACVENGKTMLNCAIFYESFDIAKVLLENGADPNIPDEHGMTPFMYASDRGYTKILGLLLDNGADITCTNKKGDTAFTLASESGHTEILELLDSWKAKEEWKKLVDWDKIDDLDIGTINKWMEHPLIKLVVDWKDDSIENGKTMLNCAIWYERFDIANVLLKHGANPNIADKYGWTPMMHACDRGHINIFQHLLEKGADLDIVGQNGDTAFTLASDSGHTEMVELLDSWKTNKEWRRLIDGDEIDELGIETIEQWMEHPNKRLFIDWYDASIEYGMTMLICALWYERLDIANVLLDHGADPNIADEHGMTPLMYAADRGYTKTFGRLLEMGADITITDKKGDTAFALASASERTEILEVLDSWMAKEEWKRFINGYEMDELAIEIIKKWMDHPLIKLVIDWKDDSIEHGKTLLNCAVWYQRFDIANAVLENGADPNIADNYGWTPLMYASDRGYTKIFGLLLEKGANLDIVDENGDTAFTLVSDSGHTEILELFDNWKAKKEWKHLIDSDEIDELAIETIEQWMEHPNKRMFIDWHDNSMANGKTMLNCAVWHERLDMAKLLLEHGANPNIADEHGMTPLMYAADRGYTKIFGLLLDKDANITIIDKKGDTAFTLASDSGHPQILELLVSVKFKEEWKKLINGDEIEDVDLGTINKWMAHPKKDLVINWKDAHVENGKTMLYCAIWYERLDIAEVLLENGADPNIADEHGMTPLMCASDKGYTQTFRLLLKKGAKLEILDKNGDTAFTVASFRGYTEILDLLEYWKAMEEWKKLIGSDEIDEVDIDTIRKWTEHPLLKLVVDWKDDSIENGKTMLNCAIWYERLDIANILLVNGADPDIADEHGMTPLMYASDRGYTKIFGRLLRKGADITSMNKKGWTALMDAAYKGRTSIVKLLLKNGADLGFANKDGNTAFTLAADGGHTDTVKLLLAGGADITVVNKNGDTAFTLASDKGDTEMVNTLLEKGADLHITDKGGYAALTTCNSTGQTVLHLACLHNKKPTVERVLQLGTDTDATDENGQSALFYAAEKGLVDIVELLLRHNSDCDKTDERSLMERTDGRGRVYSICDVKNGRTPLFIAAQNGHQNVVALLLQHGADPYLCNNKSQIPRDVSVVHVPIQQLFRIQDFFDKREQGDAYKTSYATCRDNYFRARTVKEVAPPLKDIIHDIVKYSHFANKFLELYQENREIVNWLDQDGRSVQQVACRECREAILFLGRYDLDDKPVYESPTCKIYNALDHGGPEEMLTQPRLVVAKFFEKEEHFENEMGVRRKDDGSPRFSSDFVTPHQAAYRADQHHEYAEACKAWKPNGSGKNVLPGLCVVMSRGERSLMEAMNNENLSAEHKDLERRDMLQKLCNIFVYLHAVGYVHGDIKPHNIVRHIGQNMTWKAIDFDACTKIGDTVGLKVTTGSVPPEMLKIIKGQDSSDMESMVEQNVILRQMGSGLEKSDLVLANPSFDVWSYGILMYQLVTGRSFFHCDVQGNVDDTGLQELANLTEVRIHEKLRRVKDVNARVLLSRILRLNPKERPTMSEVGKDYYFRPSESPQGRKAEFFGKQDFRTSVLHTLDSEMEEKYTSALEKTQTSRAEENSGDGGNENMKEIEKFLSSNTEFSYFKLRDEDKDWSDKLLNSEVETFHFDQLGGMGEKPRLIDGDTIYCNDFLRSLVSNKGPDYFMGFLVEYFELYKIMNDAHEVCQEIKANLVSNVKDLKGIFIKLFVRGKGLNDVVRGTLFCNSVDQFKYVGRQLQERYLHNVYIKTPKKEAGSWPIPKLLVYGNRRYQGRCMSVEIQFSTVYMHLATHASNNHLVYEAIRESTGYLGAKDTKFQEFLQSLNEQYIDTEGFLRNQSAHEGRFEIVVEQAGENDIDDENRTQESDRQTYATEATGFISSGRICCGDRLFRFMSPTDRFQRFSESSFVVNKSLTLLSSHSYWSDESYDLEGKIVEFVVSFKGRGLAIAGIGTAKCLHGSLEGKGGGSRCSLHVGRSKFVVRIGGVEEVSREKKLPDLTRAKITFEMEDGLLSVSFNGSVREDEEVLERTQVSMPSDQRYYLYMRAPPGVHDVKFHEVSIHDTVSWV